MRYIRRFMWFLGFNLLWIAIAVLIIVVAFYTAMNSSNCYVLIEDGMHARAGVILTRDDPSLLTDYFRTEFLNVDEALKIGMSEESPYKKYTVRGFTYQLTLESIWGWPWNNTATATVTERVPSIDGSALSAYAAEVQAKTISSRPPKWRGGRYRVNLVKYNGQWKIAGLTLLAVLTDPTAIPTPEPTPDITAQTPIPSQVSTPEDPLLAPLADEPVVE